MQDMRASEQCNRRNQPGNQPHAASPYSIKYEK